jgi:M-phase inducer tyrosine phosphatase
LHDLLHGKHDDLFSDLYVIDCRYDYEHDFGHITGAVNINNPAELRDFFFPDIAASSYIVFHCELSKDRGPTLARILREMDRQLNETRYPAVFYPNVFILDGGYREFFGHFRKDCEGGYRPMLHDKFTKSGQAAERTTAWRRGLADYANWQHAVAAEVIPELKEQCSERRSSMRRPSCEPSPVEDEDEEGQPTRRRSSFFLLRRSSSVRGRRDSYLADDF